MAARPGPFHGGRRNGGGLNLFGSARRLGLYRTVAVARDAFVVACLPADVATFESSAGPCLGGSQPVLNRAVAVAGDVGDLDEGGSTLTAIRPIR